MEQTISETRNGFSVIWALRTEVSTPVSKTGKVGSRPAALAIHSITP